MNRIEITNIFLLSLNDFISKKIPPYQFYELNFKIIIFSKVYLFFTIKVYISIEKIRKIW